MTEFTQGIVNVVRDKMDESLALAIIFFIEFRFSSAEEIIKEFDIFKIIYLIIIDTFKKFVHYI